MPACPEVGWRGWLGAGDDLEAQAEELGPRLLDEDVEAGGAGRGGGGAGGRRWGEGGRGGGEALEQVGHELREALQMVDEAVEGGRERRQLAAEEEALLSLGLQLLLDAAGPGRG